MIIIIIFKKIICNHNTLQCFYFVNDGLGRYHASLIRPSNHSTCIYIVILKICLEEAEISKK